MNFIETELKGAYIIELTPNKDDRGFFARTFCKKEFSNAGLVDDFVQCNASKSVVQYTLRGMHYQINESAEIKLIRCIRGKIQDVIIDVRTDSATYGKHIAVELSEENQKMLYVPTGFAHGFLTLEPNCEITYMVSNFYSPQNERGIRWNDPAFNINWAAEPNVISDKDSKHPDFIKKALANEGIS